MMITVSVVDLKVELKVLPPPLPGLLYLTNVLFVLHSI